MRKAAVIFVMLLLLLTAKSVEAESVKELTEESESFDGFLVSFNGEVIGVLIRGEYAWVNILDNGFAIGIWCDAEDAEAISFVGDYKHQGDYVSGEGIYHMACVEHGGDADIHAISFSILATGVAIDRAPNLALVLIGVVTLAAAIFISVYLWRIRKEKKKIFPWPTY